MEFGLSEEQKLIGSKIEELCSKYPSEYWRDLDRKKAYPEQFVADLTKSGMLSVLIPEEYGGSGLGITEASIILEQINRGGGNGAACHAQMYTMNVLLRHGSNELKERYLPDIASGKLRMQAFAVTEPEAGVDTSSIRTIAERQGTHFVINGRKIFTSRVQHSDLMVILARSASASQTGKSRTGGMSVFIVDLRIAGQAIKVQPIETIINHETNELLIEDLIVPEENLVGIEGEGFRYILDGLNPERILIASECVGDARFCLERAVGYAKQRIVFGRPIGQNQGVQFPLAQVYSKVEAADLMRYKASCLYDSGKPCGAEANMSKLLASEASLEAANVAMSTLGGYGMTTAYDVERKLRESRLFMVAPVPNNLILSYLAEHQLGLPRSY